jgi:hypothetical protein
MAPMHRSHNERRVRYLRVRLAGFATGRPPTWRGLPLEPGKAERPGVSRAFPGRIAALAKQRVWLHRARVRTWKTSKVSSATCHQRYWSARKAAIASIAFLKSGFLAEISA